MTMTPDANSPDTPDGGPTLHVDSDWKAQAQAEKERLAKQEEQRGQSSRRRGPDDLPPADFTSIVGVLASQAVMSLGGYGDPESGRVVVDLAGAQFAIDLLDVLEKKTAGNLEPKEAQDLKQVLTELRARFVHFASMIAKQQGIANQQGVAPTAGEPGAPTPSKPIIEMP